MEVALKNLSVKSSFSIRNFLYPTILLDGVDLYAAAGEFVVLCGPEQSGKSIILRTLALRLRGYRWSGEVLYDGRNASKTLAQRHVSYCSSQDGLVPRLTVHETLYHHCVFQFPSTKSVNHRQYTDFVLEKLGLNAVRNTRVERISAGLRSLLRIGILMFDSAKLVLLDDAIDGLDRETSRIVCDCLHKIHKNGATVIVSTNDFHSPFLKYSTSCYVLNSGFILSYLLRPCESSKEFVHCELMCNSIEGCHTSMARDFLNDPDVLLHKRSGRKKDMDEELEDKDMVVSSFRYPPSYVSLAEETLINTRRLAHSVHQYRTGDQAQHVLSAIDVSKANADWSKDLIRNASRIGRVFENFKNACRVPSLLQLYSLWKKYSKIEYRRIDLHLVVILCTILLLYLFFWGCVIRYDYLDDFKNLPHHPSAEQHSNAKTFFAAKSEDVPSSYSDNHAILPNSKIEFLKYLSDCVVYGYRDGDDMDSNNRDSLSEGLNPNFAATLIEMYGQIPSDFNDLVPCLESSTDLLMVSCLAEQSEAMKSLLNCAGLFGPAADKRGVFGSHEGGGLFGSRDKAGNVKSGAKIKGYRMSDSTSKRNLQTTSSGTNFVLEKVVFRILTSFFGNRTLRPDIKLLGDHLYQILSSSCVYGPCYSLQYYIDKGLTGTLEFGFNTVRGVVVAASSCSLLILIAGISLSQVNSVLEEKHRFLHDSTDGRVGPLTHFIGVCMKDLVFVQIPAMIFSTFFYVVFGMYCNFFWFIIVVWLTSCCLIASTRVISFLFDDGFVIGLICICFNGFCMAFSGFLLRKSSTPTYLWFGFPVNFLYWAYNALTIMSLPPDGTYLLIPNIIIREIAAASQESLLVCLSVLTGFMLLFQLVYLGLLTIHSFLNY